MATAREWALLAYRLPREPSGPRVTVWRKLRRLGAVQLVDGLVALPASADSREQFDWLADEVLEAGGEAWTFVATPTTNQQHRALLTRMSDAATSECEALRTETETLLASAGRPHPRTVERIRRDLRRIEVRDPSPSRETARLRRAVERLAARSDALEGDTAP